MYILKKEKVLETIEEGINYNASLHNKSLLL